MPASRQENVEQIDFRCVYRAPAQPDARCILNEGDQSAFPKGEAYSHRDNLGDEVSSERYPGRKGQNPLVGSVEPNPRIATRVKGLSLW
jgi:hypothetical protein